MEKRIKTLYIVTIIAIIAFLGMQIYWIYGRYEHSLNEYERNLSHRIEMCVEEYNAIRVSSSDTHQFVPSKIDDKKTSVFSIPEFSLHQEYGDTVKTTRTSRIYTYCFSAHELLGLEPGTPLTNEQKKKAISLAEVHSAEPVDSMAFDASGAKDENEAWAATSNVLTEQKSPFSVEGIDSVLLKSGIKSCATLVQADSMIWKTMVSFHSSVISPRLSITIPYSQLQGKAVCIVSPVDPFDVLPGMWQLLIVTLLVSSLLIACLALQFSTVLKLSRIDKMRNSFVMTMIHELKRPISTLKMCVSGLDNKRMMGSADVREELLSDARNALDNLSAYFSKLRDITFNDVEQIPLNIQSINLHNLFDKVAAMAATSGKTVVIRNDIVQDCIVSADPSHLYNILNNLVENAIKYSGLSVEIGAKVIMNEGFIDLLISDNGKGISSSDLKRIFNRFYRGKALDGEQPGMGLGLTYVKLLVDAHGGDISVESSEGRGTCFTLRLPQ